MTKRMLLAAIALVGVFVATYLALYNLGMLGTLACTGLGSCETVQSSKWAKFLGIPVAVWGVGYYLLVFALATVGTAERFADSRRLAMVLLVLTGWGVLFSAWLTALELFVIHAICFYCVISALIAIALFVLAVLDWRELRHEVDAPPA